MSKIFDFTGDEFHPRGLLYSSPKESTLFMSFGSHVDIYFPSRKRSRISAPFVIPGQNITPLKEVSIEVLPDELLFEVFRRLPGPVERSVCACVSKRWLSQMSNICRNEFDNCDVAGIMKSKIEADAKSMAGDDEGFLSRSLEGKRATDVRLAAIAVGTAGHGGLGKLSIRGNNGTCKVTNAGLRSVARCCPSLKTLTLWNLPKIDDDGLLELASGCHQLERVDICQCPGITNIGLAAIAKNCPNLTDLTIESCPKVGNECLMAVGPHVTNIRSLSLKDCPLVGDQGIAAIVSSSSLFLSKLKLQSLNLSDVSLAVIGHYGKSINELTLSNLTNVSERGFWVMGNAQGLQKLKTLSITSCRGITDVGLEAVGKGFPNLKHFFLRKCALLSDNGVMTFTRAAVSLESLHLEECQRITHYGLFGALINSGEKLKSLSLVRCLGIQDLSPALPLLSPCKSLKTLAIHNCPGFGDKSLSFLGKLCPQLQCVELVGLPGVSDAGLLPVIQSCHSGLSKVNVSGCANLSDLAVAKMTEHHGYSLEVLNLDNCRRITDASLEAVAKNCKCLSDLDISRCAITDSGIASLAISNDLNLQILSVSSCAMISHMSIPSFLKLGKTLIGLNLQHCNAISSSNINLLIDRLFKCDILA